MADRWGRRRFLLLACGAPALAACGSACKLEAELRQIVRSGRLGNVSYCRASLDRVWMKFVQSLVEEEPLAVAEQGHQVARMVTVRYPGFVAMFDQRGAGDSAVIYGSRATLVADASGYRIFDGS